MENKLPLEIRSIQQFHKKMELPSPEHPLISVVDYSLINRIPADSEQGIILDAYTISIKRDLAIKMIYGQQQYDFDEGVMLFTAPNQLIRIETDPKIQSERSGWLLLIHPDFLWNTPLAKRIRQYEFFDYATNEALFLSEKEEKLVTQIIQNIVQEYRSNIDPFSQRIIISQIETLLNYSDRFYQRQFITRKIVNHTMLDQLEEVLKPYFNRDLLPLSGLPTVEQVAKKLNVSPGYLSGLLKSLTGRSTQQHIQDKVIEKAKEKLSTTNLSVSEIAYGLGFEHPQSLSKLFKQKTRLSPLAFRRSFS